VLIRSIVIADVGGIGIGARDAERIGRNNAMFSEGTKNGREELKFLCTNENKNENGFKGAF
jgi:hypothetical protein